MSERIWWRQEPEGIQMTDAHARQLLLGIIEPANNDEEIFCNENASTDIPPNEDMFRIPVKEKIIGAKQKLHLHKPNNNAPLVYGEGDN